MDILCQQMLQNFHCGQSMRDASAFSKAYAGADEQNKNENSY
jgi:hypothetical protein